MAARVQRALKQFGCALLLTGLLPHCCPGQTVLTWPQIRDRFVATNPTLIAGRVGVQESRAAEITAFLRPNPNFTFATDGTQIAPANNGIYRPFAGNDFVTTVDYLHERRHKRELRRESAQQATAIAISQLADQERTLLFSLRSAFVQVLQQKTVLALAQENLTYYDQILGVSRDRRKLGDMAQVDLDRLIIQRAQYETDLQTAIVSLRTAKIQLLMLLNDRTPVEQFDVTGPYDFSDRMSSLAEYRIAALDTRPDLLAAVQSVEKARTDHRLAVANGSTDPTFSLWWTHNGSFSPSYAYDSLGASFSIPLRIFDRNQGEKARTFLDISRNERLRDAAQAQVLSDVDSAVATINSNLILLKTYKDNYLQRAAQVRDTMLFSYQRGGAALIDFIQAQQDYRSVRLNYINLIGAYLTAAAQLNLAVGREVLQ
jgi:outer membrane protein, heavy metal efflux system